MAITGIGAPENFTPVYNEVNYYLDSTNKALSGFRYVFDLYKDGVVLPIAQTVGAPRPVDGYGVSKLSNLLAPHITRTFTPLDFNATQGLNNFVKYTLKVGEEYETNWAYSDYEYYSNGASDYDGYTQLRQFSAIVGNEHSFLVGDQINIVQSDGGILKPILEGLYTVVEIVDDWTIVIGVSFSAVGSGATVGGDIAWADGRRTIIRDLLTINAIAYNGALNFLDFRLYDENDYIINDLVTEHKLLTSLGENHLISSTSDLWINFAEGEETNFVGYYYFENSDGDTFRKPNGSGTVWVKQFYAGTNDTSLTTLSGTLPLVKPTTEHYEFWTASSLGVQTSKKYKVYINQDCAIETIEILFEDRFGSFLPFLFNLRTEKTTTVKRTEYRKELGDLDSHSFGYETYDEGLTTVNALQDQTQKIRTNWLNREDAELFNILISSPTHFVKIDGVYISVKLKTLSTTLQGEGTSKLIRKDLDITYSNRDQINV